MRTRAMAGSLRAAIRVRDSKRVARVLGRFRTLNAQAANVQGLAAGALRGYARRYEAVRRAAVDVEHERNRLERDLK
jgi:hypothetical protein